VDGSTGLGGLRRQFGEPLWMVLGAVALALLVAAINVANLLLTRGVARGPELAMRIALGASRGRVMAQLVTEGSVIATVGGLLGILLSMAATPALATVISHQANGVVLDVSLDHRVLLIACAATMLTAVVIGLIPAVRAPGLRSSRSLVIGDRSRSDAGGQRIMRGLLVMQFAISLLLVTAAGLLLRTSIGLSGIALGFEQENVVALEINDEAPGGSVSINVPEDDDTKRKRAATYQQLEERLNAIADVRSASAAWYGLFSTNDLWTTVIDPLRPEDRREAHLNFVSARYFETVGMRVVRGRAFTRSDRYGAPRWRSSTRRSCASGSAAVIRSGRASRSGLRARLQPPSRSSALSPTLATTICARQRPVRCSGLRSSKGRCASTPSTCASRQGLRQA
jgi:hypothetical protein